MSRGRGGWAARGGMSNTMSISNEDKLATILTQPPPVFPPADKRPLPLTQSPDIDYMLVLRRDFVDHMQLSPAYLELPQTEENGPEQEFDQLVAQMPSNREQYDWNLFPSELKPQELLDEERRKRDLKRNAKREREDRGNVESVKVEKEDEDDVEEPETGIAEEKSLKRPRTIELNEEEEPRLKRVKTEVTEEDEELVENEEEEDEEMDDGTDYINNYFDNGEDMDDDDDNGEDGSYYL